MKKLGLFVVPVLFALGCGGLDDILKDAGNNVCAAGVTPYQIKTGNYNTTSVTAVTENCGLGLTAAMLQTTREVANDAQGNITVYSIGTSSKTALGTGPVSCNAGTLTNSQDMTINGCVFTAASTVAMTVTAPNTFTIAVTQKRSNYRDVTAGSCSQPSGGACTINYTASMMQ